MMPMVALLAVVIVCYAGYNLLVGVSAHYAPAAATTTALATLVLQLAAVTTSAVFIGFLTLKGDQRLALSPAAYGWAVAAGVCIGAAEIGYFYLYRGVAGAAPMSAAVVVPAVVCGTVVIAALWSVLIAREPMGITQWAGIGLIIAGIALLFAKSG